MALSLNKLIMDWVALKLLEGDTELTARMQNLVPSDRWESIQAILKKHDDSMLAIGCQSQRSDVDAG